MKQFYKWGYSSVVEHSTADREVTGSNPVAPFIFYFSKSNLVYGLPFIFHVLIIVIFSNEFAFCSIFRIVQGVMPVLSLDQAVLNPGSVCTIIEKSSDIITNIVISSTIWQPIDT